jgi:hypothetical protein
MTPDAPAEESPTTGEEWIIAHIGKLENAVDDILFALKAGGYATRHGHDQTVDAPDPGAGTR